MHQQISRSGRVQTENRLAMDLTRHVSCSLHAGEAPARRLKVDHSAGICALVYAIDASRGRETNL